MKGVGADYGGSTMRLFAGKPSIYSPWHIHVSQRRQEIPYIVMESC